MQLCMNEVTILRSGDLLSHIADCAAHGYSHMEIRKASLLRALKEGHTLEELRRALTEHGITVPCLNAIESISFNDRRGTRMLTELAGWLFYCCRSLGCDCVEVIASFRAPTDDPDEIRRETVRALQSLSAVAEPFGIRLALEYMSLPDSSVKTFRQCLDIVNETGRDNVGILFDTWHHYAYGSLPEDISLAKGSQIFMVHASDCPARAPGQALRPESYLPGDGVVPIADYLRCLKEIGYDGAVSLEAFDPTVQAMPTGDCLEAAKASTLRVMAEAGVLC